MVNLHQRGDIEERLFEERTVLIDNQDLPGSLDDEQSTAAVTRVCKVHGVDETTNNFDELDGDVARERPPGACHRIAEWREPGGVCILRRCRYDEPAPGQHNEDDAQEPATYHRFTFREI